MRVIVEAEVRPTEDPEKVGVAIKNIFPGSVNIEGEDGDYGRAWLEANDVAGLDKFKMILHRDRIRAAARAVLVRSIGPEGLHFFLNKQAAYAGHVSFSAEEKESPLGPIKVQISSSNPLAAIEWLTGTKEKTG